MQGFYFGVHHRCITRSGNDLDPRLEDARLRRLDRMVEPRMAAGSPRRLKARKGDCSQSDDQDGDIDLRDALGDLADDQRRQLGLRDARSSSNAGANDGSRRVLLAWRAAAAAGAAGGAIIAAPASEV
jgi:hypothetical protein